MPLLSVFAPRVCRCCFFIYMKKLLPSPPRREGNLRHMPPSSKKRKTPDTTSSTFFANIPTITYEGPDSDNPLAFKYYNADEVIMGKKMKDWCRFAVCWWHTWRGMGADIFGLGGTMEVRMD